MNLLSPVDKSKSVNKIEFWMNRINFDVWEVHKKTSPQVLVLGFNGTNSQVLGKILTKYRNSSWSSSEKFISWQRPGSITYRFYKLYCGAAVT